MTITTYTPEQQAQIIRRHGRQGIHALKAFIGRYDYQIETMAMRRAMTLGLTEYGDRSFHKTNTELWRDTMEECADGVFYRAIRIARDKGDL